MVLVPVFASCSYFKTEAEPEAIARVGESFLYQNDIVDLIPEGTSKEDSIGIVRNFINRWATQKILINAAERNIEAVKLEEFDKSGKKNLLRLFASARVWNSYVELSVALHNEYYCNLGVVKEDIVHHVNNLIFYMRNDLQG